MIEMNPLSGVVRALRMGGTPQDFVCPISLEIMTDPVILSSGHTFERSSIQRWLDSGHRSCPITKLPLPDQPFLIPNHALRSLISNYTQLPQFQSPPYPEPHALLSILTCPNSSLDSKIDSIQQLNRGFKMNPDPTFRQLFAQSGGVSVVLSFVGSHYDLGLQAKALSLLLNLSLDDDIKVGLVAEGAVSRIVSALRSGSPECRALGATMVTSLGVVEVNKATIGAYPHAIIALISLLRDGKCRERKEAATALYSLCSYPDNRRRALDAGAVPILLRASCLGVERTVEVLGVLAKCKEGRDEMAKFHGFVSTLILVLKNGSPRCVQHALSTLNLVCCCSQHMCLEAINEGVLDICFGLMEHDNEKIRRNASTLIQALQGNPSSMG